MKCQRNGIKYREKNRYVHLFKEYRLIHEILELKINNEFFKKVFKHLSRHHSTKNQEYLVFGKPHNIFHAQQYTAIF